MFEEEVLADTMTAAQITFRFPTNVLDPLYPLYTYAFTAAVSTSFCDFAPKANHSL
ncbi:hypothetical protein M404DRAFT_1006392 [Pisolithus tinctorius Marx 270]|uniref:Uncharacterized protein n=1 Tax=Pisolithus tinctorius Marx 270 TaxID=870435 RepID=A0A0C3JHC2_PISTI|nr:hypothetical protein M404DRAFT_1006392 [Pisolithus tinctorius Marx 270]